jgi:hypothetical protein
MIFAAFGSLPFAIPGLRYTTNNGVLTFVITGRLDRRFDETLAISRVEKELMRDELTHSQVLDKLARLRPKVVLGEVLERAVPEAERHVLVLDVLPDV